jgi:hypothetical protein
VNKSNVSESDLQFRTCCFQDEVFGWTLFLWWRQREVWLILWWVHCCQDSMRRDCGFASMHQQLWQIRRHLVTQQEIQMTIKWLKCYCCCCWDRNWNNWLLIFKPTSLQKQDVPMLRLRRSKSVIWLSSSLSAASIRSTNSRKKRWRERFDCCRCNDYEEGLVD